MTVLQMLKKIIGKKEKIQFTFLIIAIIISASLEVLLLSAISPLITLLLEPSAIYTNEIIVSIYQILGFEETYQLLAFLAFALAGLYIFKGVYKLGLNFYSNRFIANSRISLSEKLFDKIMGFSYLYHTKMNLADLQRMINGDVNSLFTLVNTLIKICTEAFTAIFVVGFLIIVSPELTLSVAGLAGLCAGIYYFTVRKRIIRIGRRNRQADIGMRKAVNQGLGGIKEIKILQRESFFKGRFKQQGDKFARTSAMYGTLGSVPKVMIETVCFGGAFLILALVMWAGVDVSEMIPQLSLFVVAAFRLLPSIARFATYLNTLNFNKPSILSVYRALIDEKDVEMKKEGGFTEAEVQIAKEGYLIVDNVSFTYPEGVKEILDNVSFEVPENKSIAFIGASGAGKTTLVDIILGVLKPDQGRVLYQGESLHSGETSWSSHIGYIPQNIYLLDESIRENVAFGIMEGAINEDQIWKALEDAQLADFVRGLPEGVNTVIGDRGIRLSGGQRQRIGIARALYHNPRILVLDEATSALDTETETAVMEAIMGFKGSKTLMIIAHRLSTIEHCDMVYRVEERKVVRER